jgi:GDPmannose 4,6-dehydratase
MSTVKNINVRLDPKRLRPVDADYQMFDNSKLLQYIDWSPTIKAEDMFLDLLNYWRDKISLGDIPLNR